MCAVEQFGGKRGDKEYGYLDEMLTRNLLKLDTIDTNGRESIRLARKEAIKCIQASIAVLEAKADLYLNENQENAKQTDEIKSADTNADPLTQAADQMDVDKPNTLTQLPDNTSNTDVASEIPIVQQNVESITIGEKVDDQEMKADSVEAKPEKTDNDEKKVEK